MNSFAPLGSDLFRIAFDLAPSGMFAVDATGRVLLANREAERLLGYGAGELVGVLVDELVPERLRGGHAAHRAGYFGESSARAMGAGRDLFARRRDGTEVPVEIGLNPIDTEAGAMVLASIIDITERRRAQQSLESALREKTVLLNEVHHRVKNNLQVITSLLNLQADFAADPRIRAILAESCGRVRAMALTHQLLYERKDFSYLELGDYLDRLVQSIRAT